MAGEKKPSLKEIILRVEKLQEEIKGVRVDLEAFLENDQNNYKGQKIKILKREKIINALENTENEDILPTELASEIGVSQNYIYKIQKELNLTKKNKSQELREFFLDNPESLNIPTVELAEKFGIHCSLINRIKRGGLSTNKHYHRIEEIINYLQDPKNKDIPPKEIADKFGVSRGRISQIKKEIKNRNVIDTTPELAPEPTPALEPATVQVIKENKEAETKPKKKPVTKTYNYSENPNVDPIYMTEEKINRIKKSRKVEIEEAMEGCWQSISSINFTMENNNGMLDPRNQDTFNGILKSLIRSGLDQKEIVKYLRDNDKKLFSDLITVALCKKIKKEINEQKNNNTEKIINPIHSQSKPKEIKIISPDEKLNNLYERINFLKDLRKKDENKERRFTSLTLSIYNLKIEEIRLLIEKNNNIVPIEILGKFIELQDNIKEIKIKISHQEESDKYNNIKNELFKLEKTIFP